MPAPPHGKLAEDGKTFVAVVASRNLHERRGHFFAFDDGTEIAVFRNQGGIYAVSNICPHQHSSSISDGMIDNDCVICPLHSWTFSLATGKCTDSDATLETYAVVERDGVIYVEEPHGEQPKWMNW